jgi:spectrin beta
MVQASDTGKDLEHCNALRRKLDDTSAGVDEQRIKSINVLADKLMSQEKTPNENKNVDKKRNNFNSRWRQLQGALAAYRNLLNGAYDIHLFNRDVDDTKERIAEKALIMSSDDYGRDLFAVETLRRKQDALERDMTAVKQKIFDLENEATQLMRKYPERAKEINNKLLEIKDCWDNLESLSVKRRQHLENGYHVNKFLSSVNEIQQWANDIMNKMKAIVYPNTIQECATQIELHNE